MRQEFSKAVEVSVTLLVAASALTAGVGGYQSTNHHDAAAWWTACIASFLCAVFIAVVFFVVHPLFVGWRKHRTGELDTPVSVTPRQGWLAPKELGRYLDSINQTMESHGFGRNPNLPPETQPTESTPSWRQLNDARVRRYQETRGLFLVHRWTPSQEPDQVADVTLNLHQHGQGPLTLGHVETVEYTLGPKFTNHSIVSVDATDGFAIRESMWGPMLALAKGVLHR